MTIRRARSALRTFARDVRGGASLELAFGGAALVSIAALCFDLYSRIEATAASSRAAVSMADYVSRDIAPSLDEMDALGRFLHTHEIGAPSAMVYVVSAFRQPPGVPLPAVELLWSDDSIRIGPAPVTANLAAECAQFNAWPPADFPMVPGETVVVAEVCVRLTREGSLTGKLVAGDIYRLHALPTRNTERIPAPPANARAPHSESFAVLDAVRARAARRPFSVVGAQT